MDYWNTKELPEEHFAIDPKFSQSIKINKNGSVVHIPTDVYSGGRMPCLFVCLLKYVMHCHDDFGVLVA